MSIADAERALAVAELGGRATSFEDVWLQASLIDSRERLHPLFAEVRACTEVQATVYVPELVAAWAEVR